MTDEDEKSSPDGRKTDENEDEKKFVKLVKPKTEKSRLARPAKNRKKNLSSSFNLGKILKTKGNLKQVIRLSIDSCDMYIHDTCSMEKYFGKLISC